MCVCVCVWVTNSNVLVVVPSFAGRTALQTNVLVVVPSFAGRTALQTTYWWWFQALQDERLFRQRTGGGSKLCRANGSSDNVLVLVPSFAGRTALQTTLSSHIHKATTPVTPSRLRLKCDGTREETIFRLSAKRTSPFKSVGASVQSTTGSRGVRISGSNAEYTMFRGSVKGTGYPLHSPVSSSIPLPCVTVCHHISTALYHLPSTQRMCACLVRGSERP